MSRPMHVLATVAAVAALARPAFADPGATPVPPLGAHEWYGWQTALVDVASLGTMPLEASSASFARTPSATYLFLTSAWGYVLGPPIVHAAHGYWRRGAADLALRAGAVTVGAVLGGAATGSPSCNALYVSCITSRPDGPMVGALVGAMLASIVDASFLSWDPGAPAESPPPRFTLVPVAQITPLGGAFGVSGRF